jgi:membrane-bound metal-dependent hydrolase YbcI (DUF457 family)
MSSSNTHLAIGLIAGVLGYAGYKRIRGEEIKFGGAVKAGITGGLFALAPDIIEPATNPNHRSTMHSISALVAGGYGATKGIQNSNSNELSELLIAAFAGYSSHLLADSTTPKGLPII